MRARTAGAAAALLLLFACARRPTKELEAARRGLVEAEAAQAPVYAPSSFADARRTLHEAEGLAKKRKYEDARVVALESAARSRSAIAMTAENRAKMLEALKVNLEQTERQLTDAEQEIAMAESAHVDSKQVEMFRRDLVGARAKLAEARRRHLSGDLPGGRKWSEDAKIAADMTLREIRFAIAENPISHPAPKKRRRP
jgi:hypothetical protein